MKIKDIPVLPTKILVDTYELATVPDVHTRLLSEGKTVAEVYPLPFGDYWIRARDGGLVSVERKHGDLADDWPRHLARQLQKALDNKVKNVILLVEGLLPTLYTNGRLLAGNKERGLWYDQIWSTLLRWQIEKGILIYPCHEGSAHIARALLSIQRYFRK